MTVASIAKKLSTLFNTAPALLTSQDQQNARTNIYAAPFGALAPGNLLINGSMEVSQERGTSVLVGTGNVLDCWMSAVTGPVVAQFSQSAPPSSPAFGSAFQKCYLGQATTGAALGASDANQMYQCIEGYRTERLAWGGAAATPVTLFGWFIASIAGTFSVVLMNEAGNRFYIVDVAISGPNTWEFKTVTIPGCTDGVWRADTGVGVYLILSFGAGTSRQGAINTWLTSGNPRGSAGTTNFFATTNNYVAFTGIGMLPGSEAPSQLRSPYIMRPYAEEIVLCQRHYQRFMTYHRFPAAAGGQTQDTPIKFGVPMRVTPTLSVIPGTLTNVDSSSWPFAGPLDAYAFRHELRSLAAGDCISVNNTVIADARLA